MEQNTNRMWWTIGVIVLGGLLIGGVSVLAQEGILPKISHAFVKMLNGKDTINSDDGKWVQKGNWGTNGYFVRDKDGNGIVYAIDPQQPIIAPAPDYAIDPQQPGIAPEKAIFTNSNPNLTSLRFLDKTILPTNCTLYFADNSNLKSFDTKNLDTSNVTNMSGMFSGMKALTSLDVSNFNTSNVTDMSGMFADMQSLTALDVSNFNTSNVTYMSGMFFNMQSLTTLDVSNFDTSKVTDMSMMFYGMHSLTALDVSNFNTSNVTYVTGMFEDMNLRPDTSKFDTSKMFDKDNMFGVKLQ